MKPERASYTLPKSELSSLNPPISFISVLLPQQFPKAHELDITKIILPPFPSPTALLNGGLQTYGPVSGCALLNVV